jgi:hypothetical protein
MELVGHNRHEPLQGRFVALAPVDEKLREPFAILGRSGADITPGRGLVARRRTES